MVGRLSAAQSALFGGPDSFLIGDGSASGASVRKSAPAVFVADAIAGDPAPQPDVSVPIMRRLDDGTKELSGVVGKPDRDAAPSSDFSSDFAPVETPAVDSVPGDISTGASIAVGTGVEVTIDTFGDHDWYAVTLTGGVTYIFQSAKALGGGNPDSLLRIRDSAGTQLAQDDDSGDGTYSLLTFTPGSSGTYYLDAGTFGELSTGSFQVSVSSALAAGGPDLVGGTTGTATALAIGSSINGRIDTSGDHDFYAVNLTAGQTYIFRTAGVAAATATDTVLTLRDSTGAQVAVNDDAGSAFFSGLRFTATTAGTYYLDVSAFSTGTGDFNLTAFTSLVPPVYTNDQIREQLTDTFWSGVERHFNVAPGGTITVNITALTAAGQLLARNALALWTDATGINFSEVGSGGNIVFDDNQTGAFSNSLRSGNIITSSTVNVGTDWLTTYGTGLNSYSFQTYIHEIGHAIGLGHAGNYNGSASPVDADYQNDAWASTVMSYFDQLESPFFAGQGFTRQFVVTPLVSDILATTFLYGTPNSTRTGNTTYGFNNNSGREIFDPNLYPNVTYTIVDHGGIDTVNYSGFSGEQVIILEPESFSNVVGNVGNMTIARGTVIENAIGGSGNDTIIGNSVGNLIDLRHGGDDTAFGRDGADGFYFGTAMTSADQVFGDAGNDQIGLQGVYSNLVFGANATQGVETVVMLAGNDNRFGGSTGFNMSYNITTVDANVAAGQLLTFQANTLRAGENFTLNASAETNGSILTFGGAGTDTITGGQQADGFYFGAGRWSTADSVNGGGGNDQIGFQGNFTGLSNRIQFGAAQLTSIEFIVLLSANDTRFGGGSVGQSFSYEVLTDDANVAAGQTMIISANGLTAGETLLVNGSNESDGSFRIFSGAGDDFFLGGALADEIHGGAGNDNIRGGEGADTLFGGAGNDNFAYILTADSTNTARDHIRDFATGDKIHLGGVFGGAFGQFIGSGPQTGPNQVQVIQSGNNATVFVYLDGDATADLVIDVTVADGHTITAADFDGVSGQEPIAKLDDHLVFDPAFDSAFDHNLWEVRHDAGFESHMWIGRDMAIL